MGIRDRLLNIVSDINDDIHFLKRRDVSLRFKVLNLISGDLLRNYLAVASLNIQQAMQSWERISEDGIHPEEFGYYLNDIGWRLNKASKDVEDIWEL